MKCHSALKLSGTLPFATWRDLEGTVLNEVSQTGKGKYCMLSLSPKPKKTKLIETQIRFETARG